MKKAPLTLSAEEFAALQWAHQQLEHPSFAARLCSVIGTPIEQLLELLPKDWYRRLQATAEYSIRRATDMAIASLEPLPAVLAHDRWHQALALGSGALGGLFGPLSLVVELPITTILMLRSIAAIARSEGEDLATTDTRIACLEVFALGGRSKEDNAAETGYYGLRTTLALHFAEFLDYSGGKGVALPAGIELIQAIAARFGVVISDKVAAQLVPIVSAVSGSVLNLIFMQHFQDVGRGHFIVRRLERTYGAEAIRIEYERLSVLEAEAEREYSPLEGW
ncbi:MAG: EcsC family protein [Candidatus Competibacteraceae bacterium]